MEGVVLRENSDEGLRMCKHLHRSAPPPLPTNSRVKLVEVVQKVVSPWPLSSHCSAGSTSDVKSLECGDWFPLCHALTADRFDVGHVAAGRGYASQTTGSDSTLGTECRRGCSSSLDWWRKLVT